MTIARTITNTLRNQGLKAQNVLKTTASNTLNLLTLDNFKELIRKTFLLIGAVFKSIGFIVAAPFFITASLIHYCAGLPANYTIGSEEQILSVESLEKALKKLEEPARKISCLRILQIKGKKVCFSNETIILLGRLQPKQIVLKNERLSKNQIKLLETITHHYLFDAKKSTYELKKKILHLVLPEDHKTAERLIEELAQKGERAVNVYLPKSCKDEPELVEKLKMLEPSLIMHLLQEPKNGMALLPLLTAV